MSIVAQHVREFKKVTGQASDPDLGARLIDEEYSEWCDEQGLKSLVDGRWEPHHELELKELADLVYVIYAYADTMGWDLDIAINRVHKNNLARVIQDDGGVKFREDGKVLKNPIAPKVNLSDLI